MIYFLKANIPWVSLNYFTNHRSKVTDAEIEGNTITYHRISQNTKLFNLLLFVFRLVEWIIMLRGNKI